MSAIWPCPYAGYRARPPPPLDVRVCFRPHTTLRQSLVHLKDHTPPKKKAVIVYRIRCRPCVRVYIGQTGRTLNQRLKEHKRASDIRKPSTISYRRACHGRDVRDRLEGGTSRGQSSTLHSTMHIGGVAYQVGEEQFK